MILPLMLFADAATPLMFSLMPRLRRRYCR